MIIYSLIFLKPLNSVINLTLSLTFLIKRLYFFYNIIEEKFYEKSDFHLTIDNYH